jgi:hypothetical protein
MSTTSFHVPGRDFALNNNYVEEPVFSTRDGVSNPPYFTTGVPEPLTWVMMFVGFEGLGYAAFRRGARGADRHGRLTVVRPPWWRPFDRSVRDDARNDKLLDRHQHPERERQHHAVPERAGEDDALLPAEFRHRDAGGDILRRDHLAHHSA